MLRTLVLCAFKLWFAVVDLVIGIVLAFFVLRSNYILNRFIPSTTNASVSAKVMVRC